MIVPEKSVRDEWRRLANDTMMVSAVGEYTPTEFTVLLDAVDELERRNKLLREALSLHRSMVLSGEKESSASVACYLIAMKEQK